MKQKIEIKSKVPLVDWCVQTETKPFEAQIVSIFLNQFESEEKSRYLNPSLDQIPDPTLLKDVTEAAHLFCSVIEAKKKIVIAGDYDVDGITSTALLERFFWMIGFSNYEYFIPNRFGDGYGLSESAVDSILEKKPNLVITVDNGITARKEVERLEKHGVQVIITDHHEQISGLKPTCLVVNPIQNDCQYPEKKISGVGVAFLFLVAARKVFRERNFWNRNRKEPNLLHFLDLVALGTISDQMPLLGVNRVFCKFGLDQMTKVLQKTDPGPFYYYLQQFALHNKISSFSSQVIAFRLAPLLNASGRMKNASEGVAFLNAKTKDDAEEMYEKLSSLNQQRKVRQNQMSDFALKKIEEQVEENAGILLYDESFHEGLIGIVANHLSDRFSLPVVVLAKGSGDILKASCRSKNVSILEILKSCSEHLEYFGGHANAAGCSLKQEALEKFRKKFYTACSEIVGVKIGNYIDTDIEVKAEMLTFSLIEQMKIMEPFGNKNRNPLFMLYKEFLPPPIILTGKHLKWKLSHDMEMIYWNGLGQVPKGKGYDIAFTFEINEFRGIRSRLLLVKAITCHTLLDEDLG